MRFRLETHLQDPTLDPLSNQVWAGYLKLPQLLKEPFSILDAGCMSGFLYHHLKRYFSDFTYTGIDRWPEALEVGREFAPEVKFILGDFMTHDNLGLHDYVVCSNIPFKAGEAQRAIEGLMPCAVRKLIMIYPGSKVQIFDWNSRSTFHTLDH